MPVKDGSSSFYEHPKCDYCLEVLITMQLSVSPLLHHKYL